MRDFCCMLLYTVFFCLSLSLSLLPQLELAPFLSRAQTSRVRCQQEELTPEKRVQNRNSIAAREGDYIRARSRQACVKVEHSGEERREQEGSGEERGKRRRAGSKTFAIRRKHGKHLQGEGVVDDQVRRWRRGIRRRMHCDGRLAQCRRR